MSIDTRRAETTAAMIGKLCVNADAACRAGDLDGLRLLARQLAVYVSEPLHCELQRVANGTSDVITRWNELKDRLYRGRS